MKPDEANKALKYLAGLFPCQLTTETGTWFLRHFRDFDYSDVIKAIDAHRESPHVTANKGFLDCGQLLEGCRAEANARQKGRAFARREGSWADVYRRLRPDLKDSTDVEVVMHVHRGWWRRCGKSDGYRRQFERSCVSLLVSFGIPPESAALAADAVFGAPDDYDRALTDLVDNVRPATLALPAPA
jgi:hypothetical protein